MVRLPRGSAALSSTINASRCFVYHVVVQPCHPLLTASNAMIRYHVVVQPSRLQSTASTAMIRLPRGST